MKAAVQRPTTVFYNACSLAFSCSLVFGNQSPAIFSIEAPTSTAWKPKQAGALLKE